MEFIKKMWKIFLIGFACIIPIAWGRCEIYAKCYEQATYQTRTMVEEHPIEAPRLSPDFINYATVMPQFAPMQDTKTFTGGYTNPTRNSNSYPWPANNPTIQSPAPAAPRAPSPAIVFPDEITDSIADEITEIPSESFSAKLFERLARETENQNMLFSPMSLQTVLSFIYTISDKKLAQELAHLLELPQNRSYVAQQFQALTSSPYNSNVNNTLIMANKLYYEKRLGIVRQNIRNFAVNSFAADVEPLDFLAPQQSSNTINTWISEQTRHLIRNIITSDSLKPDTRAVLINSLYFKSEWQQKFSTYDTEKQPFFLSQKRQVTVDMMYIEDVFRYGVFDELQAKVIELPYKLADFRMMIILPNEVEGLLEVENRLAKTSLKSISARLQDAEVTVKLPQFNIEFEVDFVQALQQLGLSSLFNSEAGIKLFEDQTKPIHVDQVKQKTFISVNEAGTEAAAVTFATFVPLSIPLRMKHFTADHPFIFVIRNSNATYFMGHVVHFNDQN